MDKVINNYLEIVPIPWTHYKKREFGLFGAAGQILGKRARGRQRIKFMDCVKSLCNTDSVADVFNQARERDGWKLMTAEAYSTCGI